LKNLVEISKNLRFLLTIAASFLIGMWMAQTWEMAYAQTPPTGAELLQASVYAVAGIITTIGSIITWLVGKLRSTNFYSKMDQRQKTFIDTVGDVAKSMQGTDEGVAEHAGMIKVLADFTARTPEGKNFLEQYGMTIDKFNNDVKKWNSDLKAYYKTMNPLPDDTSNDEMIRKITTVRKNFVPAPEFEQ
jgi:hypothetical protein